jgi:hypothetical protein
MTTTVKHLFLRIIVQRNWQEKKGVPFFHKGRIGFSNIRKRGITNNPQYGVFLCSLSQEFRQSVHPLNLLNLLVAVWNVYFYCNLLTFTDPLFLNATLPPVKRIEVFSRMNSIYIIQDHTLMALLTFYVYL